MAEATHNIQLLRTAIHEGEAAGMDAQELEVARQELAEAERKQAVSNASKSAATRALYEAIAGGDIEKLRAAIHEADAVGLNM